MENFEDLIKQPVSHLLIMSAAFGQKIKDKVLGKIDKRKININCLNDFIEKI